MEAIFFYAKLISTLNGGYFSETHIVCTKFILTFKKVENFRISYFLHKINFDFEKVESFESPPHSLQAVNLR